jgi:mRNA interferase HigB
MRVITRKALRQFWEKHPDSEKHLKDWLREAEHVDWANSAEVKARYPSCSIVSRNRVVFNICWNKYRLVTAINYKLRIVYIRFIGTHKEYDKIDCERI